MDHRSGDVYVLALAEPADEHAARRWVDSTSAAVRALAQPTANGSHGSAANGSISSGPAPARPAARCQPASTSDPQPGVGASALARGSVPRATAAAAREQRALPPFRLRRPRQRYLADVEACLAAMCAGESYELCLTTALARRPAPDAAALYRALRRINAAPYAAFLAFGAGGPQVVHCSCRHAETGSIMELVSLLFLQAAVEHVLALLWLLRCKDAVGGRYSALPCAP